MKVRPTISALLCTMLVACAQLPVNDPLQNTKKLVAEGHATLYNNGAFEVPMTTIHIIPAGPGALDLAMELGGMRARQSFEESIKHARESVDVAQAGIEKSKAASQSVKEGSAQVAAGAHGVANAGFSFAKLTPNVTRAVIGASVTYSKEAGTAVAEAGESLAAGSLTAGDKIGEATEHVAANVWSGSLDAAKRTSAASAAAADRHATLAAERFVRGYAAASEKRGQRAAAVKESASLEKFTDAYRRSDEWRSARSGEMTEIIVNTTGNYSKDIGSSFSAAKREINEGVKDSGPSLALLKSMGWVLQGIFWDAAIKPVGKVAGATLGYVAVNGVAFPALILAKEGGAVANVAVQVTWNTGGAFYDVTAPTATAALAGLFSAVELAGGQAVAGGEVVGGAVAAGGTYAIGKAAAGTTKVVGYGTGKAVYLSAPLSTIGIEWGGKAVGVVAGAATGITGGAVAATGVVGEAAAKGGGFVAEKGVLVGGSAASIAAGTALGIYELSKAVVVPTGYALGSGVVLGYDTVAQLSAQTVLAVADASYMVLSLEGPNWVLYAVKGNLGKGDDLPSGAILDLKAMQQAGETFVAVPVSSEEMKRVVNTVPSELPVKPQPATTASAAGMAENK
jgi:hypothetical protein